MDRLRAMWATRRGRIMLGVLAGLGMALAVTVRSRVSREAEPASPAQVAAAAAGPLPEYGGGLAGSGVNAASIPSGGFSFQDIGAASNDLGSAFTELFTSMSDSQAATNELLAGVIGSLGDLVADATATVAGVTPTTPSTANPPTPVTSPVTASKPAASTTPPKTNPKPGYRRTGLGPVVWVNEYGNQEAINPLPDDVRTAINKTWKRVQETKKGQPFTIRGRSYFMNTTGSLERT